MSFFPSIFPDFTPPSDPDKRKEIFPAYHDDNLSTHDFPKFFSGAKNYLFESPSQNVNLSEVLNENILPSSHDNTKRYLIHDTKQEETTQSNKRSIFDYSPMKFSPSEEHFRVFFNGKNVNNRIHDQNSFPITPGFSPHTKQNDPFMRRDFFKEEESGTLFDSLNFAWNENQTGIFGNSCNKIDQIPVPNFNKTQQHSGFEEQPDHVMQQVKQEFDVMNEEEEKVESMGEDDKDDQFEKEKTLKGLKFLSRKVIELVKEKNGANYKEVADLLVKRFGDIFQSQGKMKEERNIRRRVYDALNVLIASGALRKEGKLVTCPNDGLEDPVKKENMQKKLIQLKKRMIETKIRKNEGRLETLQGLMFKTLALKNIVKTNKERRKEEANGEGEQSGKIMFPFLAIRSDSQQNDMNVIMDATQHELTIDSKYPLNIFGDVEILLKLDFHHVDQAFFNQHLPEKLIQYLPSDFFN